MFFNESHVLTHIHTFCYELQTKTLQKFVCSAIPFDSRDVDGLLEPLLRDRSRDVRSKASLAWQEISTVLKYFRQFGGKENVSNVMFNRSSKHRKIFNSVVHTKYYLTWNI